MRDDAQISILAPARGATHHLPRTAAKRPISILAPARGATYGYDPQSRQLIISILAPARGATRAVTPLGIEKSRFQSSLPRGERHNDYGGRGITICKFQSSLPRGERQSISSKAKSIGDISILAPARGAT